MVKKGKWALAVDLKKRIFGSLVEKEL